MPSICLDCACMVTCPECGNREIKGQSCSWCRALAEVSTLRAQVITLEASIAFERCTVAELRLGVHRSDRRVELAERERDDLRAQLAAVTAERDEARCTVDVLRGFDCAIANGVDGRGGCGLCPACARDQSVRRETAEIRLCAAEAKLAAVTAERDTLSANLDAMTNQAVMLSGRRATIVDVGAADEVEALRERVAELEAAMPSDDALPRPDHIEMIAAAVVHSPAFDCLDHEEARNLSERLEALAVWLARLDTARRSAAP